MITTNVPTLKINKLTQAQYERELANGNINENEIYLTPDNSTNSGNVNLATQDWNQNDETQPDYIKNRTHYLEPVDVVVSLAESTSLESISTPNGTLYRRKIATVSSNNFNICTITYDSNNHTENIPIANSIWQTLPISYLVKIGPTSAMLVHDTSSSSLYIYFTASYYNPTINGISDIGIIHQLSDSFIPDSISREGHKHALNDGTLTGTLSVEYGGTGCTSIVDTTYTTARYRASSLHSTETNPSSNGVICWTYE